ncbi:MAG: FHA domain-containing protein [Gemmatimonadaceae bacterium]
MPYLQLQDRQIPLPSGEATIGAFDGAVVRLPTGDPGHRAVIVSGPSGVIIRRGSADAVVMVNGVQLGGEPSPLLHGDRIELAGHELRLGDDQKVGSTQFVSAADVAAMVAAGKPAGAPKKPTTATGGRLVSLMDGREYAVPDTGISFGREVGNDVVLASNEVSRKHASIAPANNGYVLSDHSTNGVWVNGLRVAQSQVLGRGDVIKMGTEEFRFYADVAKAAPVAPAPASAPPAPPAPAPPPPAPENAPPPPAPTSAPESAAPSPAAARTVRVPLATLAVIAEGPLKGMKFELHSALTNIGRGDHNDIAIRDESISDSHAKLQKRADGWWIVDQGSTNGTYVGGRRVQGEQRLEGAPDIRFGGIKMTFRPIQAGAEAGGSTRAIAAVTPEGARRSMAAKTPEGARRSTAAKTPALAKAPAVPKAPEKKKGCGAMIAFFVTLVGAGAGFLALLLVAGR